MGSRAIRSGAIVPVSTIAEGERPVQGGAAIPVYWVNQTSNGDSPFSTEVVNVPQDHTTIEAALAAITDASASKRYAILVSPGVYSENNPLQLKEWVNIVAVGGLGSTVVSAANGSADLFTGVGTANLYGLSLSGVTGASNYAINMSVAGNMIVQDVNISNSSNGILLNNASGAITLNNITAVALSGTIGVLLRNEAGNMSVSDLDVASISTITTLISADGATAFTTIDVVNTFSTNLTTAVLLENSSQSFIRSFSIVGATTGVNAQSGANIRMGNGGIFNCTTGLSIPDVGASTVVGLSSVNINSNTTDVSVQSATATIFGSIQTVWSNTDTVPDASIYLSVVDLFEGDEGLNNLGELHVGAADRPSESVFGGGDSTTRGMLVYTYNGSTYTDVSEAAASPSGSTFTFPGITAGNMIYVGWSLQDEADYLIHHGIKCSIETAAVLGAGSIVLEYWTGASWVELNGMVTDGGEPFLPYAKDYFSRTGSFQIRHDIVSMNDGSWVANDDPSVGTNYYWTRYRISSDITTAPIFQQFKLHPPRSEFNSDGFLEYFGDARAYAQLAISVGSGRPFEGNMQNQTIYMDENIGVGYQTNRFTATGDKFGWEIIAPNNMDTSSELAFRWCGRPSATETITWTVRWTWQSPEGTVYTSEPAGGSNPNSQSTTTSKAVTAGELSWFDAYLDISNLLARRDTDFPDMMMISIQPSTMGGNFDLMGVQAYYLTWSGGGHAD